MIKARKRRIFVNRRKSPSPNLLNSGKFQKKLEVLKPDSPKEKEKVNNKKRPKSEIRIKRKRKVFKLGTLTSFSQTQDSLSGDLTEKKNEAKDVLNLDKWEKEKKYQSKKKF